MAADARPAREGAGAQGRRREKQAPAGRPGRGADGLRWRRSTPPPTAKAPTVARGRAVERAQGASSVGPELRRARRARPGAGRIITSHLRGSLRSWAPPDSAEPTIRSGTEMSCRRLAPAFPSPASDFPEGGGGREPCLGAPGSPPQEATAFRLQPRNSGEHASLSRSGQIFVSGKAAPCKIFPPCGRRATPPARVPARANISLTFLPLYLKSH
jgi:hypothetical protein